jgi:hypothetical protein
MDDVVTMNKREVYGFLDLLGDLGGIQDIIILTLGYFIFPVSEFSYNIKALSKMFLVNTQYDDVVLEPS